MLTVRLNYLTLWKGATVLQVTFFSAQLLLHADVDVDLRNSKDLGSEAKWLHEKYFKLLN